MLDTATTLPQHWLPLATFFAIVALCGLLGRQRPAHHGLGCVAAGAVALGVNSALLLLADRVGYGDYDLLQLVTLQDAAVESTIIIIGYCLVIRGLAVVLRNCLMPRPQRYF